jgi:tRNA pseudouridine38-40 synthase
MRNIKLTISYDGTGYSGWQFQNNGRSIQQEIEETIEKVFKEKRRVMGASRTDAGVHAKAQSANVKLSAPVPIDRIPAALNAALPASIAIVKAEIVPASFDAQHKAKSKRYRYYVVNSIHKDPFGDRYAWRMPYPLSVPAMKKEAKALIGKHDFKSFQASDTRERASVRTIYKLEVKKKGDTITFDIEANAFLYNMVRNIVGTLIDVGRGYLPAGSTEKILALKDRKKAGPTAPARGLFLIEVKY